jgi:hypothetical protein
LCVYPDGNGKILNPNNQEIIGFKSKNILDIYSPKVDDCVEYYCKESSYNGRKYKSPVGISFLCSPLELIGDVFEINENDGKIRANEIDYVFSTLNEKNVYEGDRKKFFGYNTKFGFFATKLVKPPSLGLFIYLFIIFFSKAIHSLSLNYLLYINIFNNYSFFQLES